MSDEIEEDDPEICNICDGTGEGRVDGTSCWACWGSGVQKQQMDDDDAVYYSDLL